MKAKKARHMKVYGQSGYKYKTTPTIMLKGEWLKEVGFEIGDFITVTCENGKLVITPREEISFIDGKLLEEYSPNGSASEAYRNLAKELLSYES